MAKCAKAMSYVFLVLWCVWFVFRIVMVFNFSHYETRVELLDLIQYLVIPVLILCLVRIIALLEKLVKGNEAAV